MEVADKKASDAQMRIDAAKEMDNGRCRRS